MSGPKTSTALSGAVISILVIAAIGSIGFFQFAYAPGLFSSSSTSEVSTTSSTSGPPQISVPVSILPGASSFGAQGYGPTTITVVIGYNATVVWTNNDQAPHTVTSTSAPTGGAFDSANMNQGDVYTHTFAIAGTYQYHCSYHSWMVGTVIVKPAGTVTQTTASTSTGSGSIATSSSATST